MELIFSREEDKMLDQIEKDLQTKLCAQLNHKFPNSTALFYSYTDVLKSFDQEGNCSEKFGIKVNLKEQRIEIVFYDSSQNAPCSESFPLNESTLQHIGAFVSQRIGSK